MASINLDPIRYVHVRYNGKRAHIAIEDRTGTNISIPLNEWSINVLCQQLSSLIDILSSGVYSLEGSDQEEQIGH